MMSEETYNMSWGSYAQNATTLLANLINETDFTDVTLVCEGGKYIKAHKVILSGSSYFFNNFIRTITHQNPVVYLSGIAYEDLQAILELIYLGKTEVVQENLENFVKTAEKLKIIGLTEDVGVSGKNSVKPLAPPTNEMEKKEQKMVTYNYQQNMPTPNYQEKMPTPTPNYQEKMPTPNYQEKMPTSNYQEKIPTTNYQEKMATSNFQAKTGAINGGKPKEAPVVLTNTKKPSRMGQLQLHDQKPDLPLLSCEKCPYTSYDSERLGVHMLHSHALQYKSSIVTLNEQRVRAGDQGGLMQSENLYKNQALAYSRRL